MELIQISLPCGSFYNPGTGEFIADTLDGVNPSSKSIKGSWNHEIIDQPDFFDDALASAWDSWYEKLLNAYEDSSEDSFVYIDYEKMLEKFLTEFEHEDWAAFKIMSSQFGCGPSLNINWYVLDLAIIDEE